MPLSYVALMSSSSAPAGSGTVRTNEPYENSECPLDSLVWVRSALIVQLAVLAP